MGALTVCILASGSGGNAAVIHNDETMILVDAGISCGQVNKRMQALDLDPQDIDACLITHEHSDHVKGLRVLAKRYGTPLFLHPATHHAASRYLDGSETVRYFELGETFPLGNLQIQSVPTLHDAAAPTGFVIAHKGTSVGYLTDLGAVTEDNFLMMREVDHIVMEANHDRDMLWDGPYPAYLKARVDSRLGHLANPATGEFLRVLSGLGRVQGVTLAHLSEQNNQPDLARRAVEDRQERDLQIRIAEQDHPLKPLVVENS